MPKYLDFESFSGDEQYLNELKATQESNDTDKEEKDELQNWIDSVESRVINRKKDIYSNLTPFQAIQVARHIERPSTIDYINLLCGEDFFELHGDREFGDDKAIVGGIGKIGEYSVMLIGHQKGHDTEENINRNFGMAHPEGYRKAIRLMHMAEHFNLPIITFIDTPGAFPGIGAEERGQSNAIAESLAEMSEIRVPILCFVTGEGGSGGALALGVGDRIFMFEYSVYSVISAEGCAAILWNDPSKVEVAAGSLQLRAKNLLEAGIIDGILPEPLGAAHRDYRQAAEEIRKCIFNNLPCLKEISADELIIQRYKKFRAMGKFALQGEVNA
ncbi:MAG: acetyl-CoA carboxylase carboxyltransferase subunit alpha [Candidatus Riflebacteria bacterium]|nr:acetyl-CoA carboxylase carboxyltransferase subunit alpha [Candidatus Riflebacteria bacterium]